MKINAKQLDAVISLTSEKRYQHFVKRIADVEEVWALYSDGWALSATEDGTSVFPFWPAREYAEKCAINECLGYEPRALPLDEFLNSLLPRLKADGVLPGVFPNLVGDNVTPTVERLIADINIELENY